MIQKGEIVVFLFLIGLNRDSKGGGLIILFFPFLKVFYSLVKNEEEIQKSKTSRPLPTLQHRTCFRLYIFSWKTTHCPGKHRQISANVGKSRHVFDFSGELKRIIILILLCFTNTENRKSEIILQYCQINVF